MEEINITNNSTTPFNLDIRDVEITVICVNLIFGIPLRSFVLWLIASRSGASSELFLLSLSVCEVWISVDSLLFVISKWISSIVELSLFLQGLGITGRPLFQCLMCVERYLAVVHPVTFLKYKPLRYRLICCTIAWIFTLSSCTSCLLILVFSTAYAHAMFFLVQFFLFLFIQLFCLVAVLRALKLSGPGERKTEENHRKRRSFYMIVISAFNMIIVNIPYTVIAFSNIFTQHTPREQWISAMICYVLSSFSHLFFYLHRAGKLSCFHLS